MDKDICFIKLFLHNNNGVPPASALYRFHDSTWTMYSSSCSYSPSQFYTFSISSRLSCRCITEPMSRMFHELSLDRLISRPDNDVSQAAWSWLTTVPSVRCYRTSPSAKISRWSRVVTSTIPSSRITLGHFLNFRSCPAME